MRISLIPLVLAAAIAALSPAKAQDADDSGPDTPVAAEAKAPKLTRAEEQKLRINSLVFAAQTAEKRGDTGTALAHYVRAVTLAPNDGVLLTATGRLALEEGDPKAAFGFLVRAASMNPRDAGLMVLLGRALAQDDRPRDALRIFERASHLGADENIMAADRGLARDLLGDQRRAQRDYQLALSRTPGDPTIIGRLGLSQAIAGDAAGALRTLQPLASQQDAMSRRTLAFAYALNGDTGSAMNLARAAMGPAAEAMMTFINRLPRLNEEQKARAVHFGELPAESAPVRTAQAADKEGNSWTNRLMQALRPAANRKETPPQAEKTAAVTPPSTPSSTLTPTHLPTRPAPVPAPEKAAAVDPVALLCGDVKGRAQDRCEVDTAALVKRCAAGRKTAECIQLAERASAASRASARAVAETKPASPADPLDILCPGKSGVARNRCLVDNRALLRRCANGRKTGECLALASRLEAGKPTAKPEKEREDDMPATKTAAASADTALTPDAVVAAECGRVSASARRQCEVDSRALARRCTGGRKTGECLALAERIADGSASKGAEAKEKPSARKPASRLWVQVAGGVNRADLPKAWTRLKAKPALKGQDAWIGGSGRTNRLLIGPFKDEAEVRQTVNKLQAGGVSSFPFTSAAGETIEAL